MSGSKTVSREQAPSLPSGEGPSDARGWGRRPSAAASIVRARALRKRLTPQEAKLWNALREGFRAQGHNFRRQVPIDRFIIDFACLRPKVAIEIDGGQHNEGLHAGRDQIRDTRLKNLGFRVLRFWNHEFEREMESVLMTIHAALEACASRPRPHPSPAATPSPKGREGASLTDERGYR